MRTAGRYDGRKREANGVMEIEIDSISKIVAFKRDLLTEDQLCWILILKDGTSIELNEDMNGFDEFVETISKKLKGFDKNWRHDVIPEAFVRNQKVIWNFVSEDFEKRRRAGP